MSQDRLCRGPTPRLPESFALKRGEAPGAGWVRLAGRAIRERDDRQKGRERTVRSSSANEPFATQSSRKLSGHRMNRVLQNLEQSPKRAVDRPV